MITGIIVSGCAGALTIVLAETLRRQKRISSESSRKILHLAHGVVVAPWPFFVGYSFIIAAEAAFLVLVLLARWLRILQPLRKVNRRSLGDIFFPLGIIALALFTPAKNVFVVALLHLAIADAFAALVGRRFREGVYHIFGQRKTIAGSLTFLLISVIVTYCFVDLVPGYSMIAVIIMPLVTTAVENFSPYGSDNVTLPLTVLGLLHVLSGFGL